ncbi:MAG: hypothetical protein ABIR52_08580 [Casimicrobiaceae bacterium]
MRTMSGEPLHAAATVLKCAVGLALLALIAVIGVSGNNNEMVASATSGAGRASTWTGSWGPAAAHRKQVFDERRAQLESAEPSRVVAGSAREYAMEHVAP